MFRQGQLAVQGLGILLGRNKAGISNRGKIFLHHAVQRSSKVGAPGLVSLITAVAYHFCLSLPAVFTQQGASSLADLCTSVFGLLDTFVS